MSELPVQITIIFCFLSYYWEPFVRLRHSCNTSFYKVLHTNIPFPLMASFTLRFPIFLFATMPIIPPTIRNFFMASSIKLSIFRICIQSFNLFNVTRTDRWTSAPFTYSFYWCSSKSAFISLISTPIRIIFFDLSLFTANILTIICPSIFFIGISVYISTITIKKCSAKRELPYSR